MFYVKIKIYQNMIFVLIIGVSFNVFFVYYEKFQCFQVWKELLILIILVLEFDGILQNYVYFKFGFFYNYYLV